MAKWGLAAVQAFLDEQHPNKYTVLSWLGTKHYCEVKCTCGTQWRPLGQQLVNKGQGCPTCGKILSAEKQRTTIEHAQSRLDLAGKGLVIIPGTWKGTQYHCTVRCSAEHEWQTKGTKVLNENTSCRKCFELKRVKWSITSIGAEAVKYKSKSEFQIKAASAYSAAYKYFPELLNGLFTNIYECWSEERVKLISEDYVTKIDFLRGCAGAYRAASRLGILDELFDNQETTFNTREMIYIWKVVGLADVYKVGITSSNRGLTRIKEVAKAAGVAYELLLLENIGSFISAIKLESYIKKLGYKVDMGCFNGYTEFRKYTSAELEVILRLIKA